MINSLFIANRGEIASRIIRTCRRLGIRSIVPYTAPDRAGQFVSEADEALFVDTDPPSKAYLEIDRLLSLARGAGAEALHPGYGFLSESAELSARAREAGLIFVGPPPEVLTALGAKDRARVLAIAHGVPVAPGYDGPEQDLAQLAARAEEIGFPLLIKAAGGGGGRGMKRIDAPHQLLAGLESARREAETFFGDGTLILERLIAPARHIEVQIAGDRHGDVVHFFERDCSLQRNYQKVIEESPARELPERTANALYRDAVSLGKAAGLCGLATVEFLVPAEAVSMPATSGPALPSHIFLEINPRLQVEHPVTEMRVGIDLVELQLRIACGEPLPCTQESITARGSAIEARICAEVPHEEFRPSGGIISRVSVAEAAPGEGALRFEHTLAPGFEVGTGFDSLIMKVIAYGESHGAAVEILRDALCTTAICGLDTNQSFLIELLDHTAASPPDTGWIGRYLADATAAPLEHPVEATVACGAAAVHRALHAFEGILPPELGYFRSTLASRGVEQFQPPRYLSIEAAGYRPVENLPLAHAPEPGSHGGRGTIESGGRSFRVALGQLTGSEITLTVDGAPHRFVIEREQLLPELSRLILHRDGTRYRVELGRARRADRGGHGIAHSGTGSSITLTAPLPGVILKLLAAAGDQVERGAPLVIIESMKMEHTLFAPWDGRIARLFVSPKTAVKNQQPLLELIAS